MPIYGGREGTFSKPNRVLLGIGSVAGIPVKRVMRGSAGTAAVEVWPGKKVFKDNFDRADQVLGQASNWYTIGTSPYFIWVVGNNAKMYDDGNDGQRLSWSSWMEDTTTDVHYSKGKIINIGNASRGFWVSCQSSQDGTNYMGFQWTGTSLQLFTCIDGVTTARGSAGTKTQVVDDWLEIRASVHPTTGIYTYNGYVNGNLYCTWTDSTNLVKKGAAWRRVGFGLSRNRAFFTSTFSTQFSEWEGGDF